MADRAITYHSLTSKYDGDFTKGCSLIASEIDGNFYFLRGMDIVSAEYVTDDSGATKLVLTRVNGDTIETQSLEAIEVEKAVSAGLYDFEYDKINHKLIITYPDGEVKILDQKGNDKVSTSNGIKGNGSTSSPVRLAVTERTGVYAPAEQVVEIEEDGLMPNGKLYGKGYRIVTKEDISGYGKLYDYFGVEKITKALEDADSDWHVPTKEEWDGLLNGAEYEYNPCNNEGESVLYTGHSVTGSAMLGVHAGAALKEAGYQTWGPLDSDEYKGEDVYGLSILPLGYAGSRGSFLNDNDNDVSGFHEVTAFWTSTEAGIVASGKKGDSVYAKVFDDNSNGVGQLALVKTSKLSLRLVKDYDGENFNEYEEILGRFYPCEHVVINDLDGNLLYSKIWITVNFDNNDESFGGVASEDWEEPWYGEFLGNPESVEVVEMDEIPASSAITEDSPAYIKVGDTIYSLNKHDGKIRFFICEWNGKSWEKKLMSVGDAVVIIDHEGKHLHEWRVEEENTEDHKLVDIVEQMQSELDSSMNNRLDAVEETIDDLETKLNAEILRASAAEDSISGNVTTLSGNVVTISEDVLTLSGTVETIEENLENEIKRATEAESIITSALTSEIDRATSAETELNKAIEGEIARATSAETEISTSLTAEIERATTSENTISSALTSEIDRATSAETELNKAIEDEVSTREANDVAAVEKAFDLMEENVVIKNNNGDTLFTIVFDGNFGTI